MQTVAPTPAASVVQGPMNMAEAANALEGLLPEQGQEEDQEAQLPDEGAAGGVDGEKCGSAHCAVGVNAEVRESFVESFKKESASFFTCIFSPSTFTGYSPDI